MPKFSFTKIVNVDRDKIFNVITDFENLAKIFPKYFKSLKIISKSGNITKLEEELEFLGKKLNVTVDHIVEEPDKHTVIMLDGPGKNTKFEEIFEKMPEGTKITVDVDLVLNGKFKVMGFFAKKQIKNKMSQALDEFAEVAKNN
jgi:carbon monoxide dehydrogenase subunit G